MKRAMIISGAMLLSGAFCLVFAAGGAGAQEPPKVWNQQIEIAYGQPRDPAFQPIHDRLTNLRVLEEFRQFMAPLRLPSKLAIRVDQCDAAARHYKPHGPVTVCYELLDRIERIVAKAEPGARKTMIVGTFIQVLLHDVAHAVFDILQVPVWGRAEDAADDFAAFVMLQFGDELARQTIQGSTDFFLLSGKTWTGADFASAASPERQRYFNYLCMAYGSDPKTFEFLAKGVDGAQPVLPQRRAKQCDREYETFRLFFDLRIMPYIDPDLLVAVRAMPWPAQLQ
jgi:Putative metallopeptidase